MRLTWAFIVRKERSNPSAALRAAGHRALVSAIHCRAGGPTVGRMAGFLAETSAPGDARTYTTAQRRASGRWTPSWMQAPCKKGGRNGQRLQRKVLAQGRTVRSMHRRVRGRLVVRAGGHSPRGDGISPS